MKKQINCVYATETANIIYSNGNVVGFYFENLYSNNFNTSTTHCRLNVPLFNAFFFNLHVAVI